MDCLDQIRDQELLSLICFMVKENFYGLEVLEFTSRHSLELSELEIAPRMKSQRQHFGTTYTQTIDSLSKRAERNVGVSVAVNLLSFLGAQVRPTNGRF